MPSHLRLQVFEGRLHPSRRTLPSCVSGSCLCHAPFCAAVWPYGSLPSVCRGLPILQYLLRRRFWAIWRDAKRSPSCTKTLCAQPMDEPLRRAKFFGHHLGASFSTVGRRIRLPCRPVWLHLFLDTCSLAPSYRVMLASRGRHGFWILQWILRAKGIITEGSIRQHEEARVHKLRL